MNALTGEKGAYTPCDDLAAPVPDLPQGAIRGQNGGYVAQNQAAAGVPDAPYGAVVGATGSFVPAPCVTCCGPDSFESFDDRTTTSADWGSSSRDAIAYTAFAATGYETLVENGNGVFRAPYHTTLSTAFAWARLLSGPPVGSTDWTMKIRYKIPLAPEPSEINVITHEPGINVEQLRITGAGPVSPTTKYDVVVGDVRSEGASQFPNIWYCFKFEWSHSLRLQRSKLWIDGDPEPVGWDSSTAWPGGFDGTTNRWEIGFAAREQGTPVQPVNAEVLIDCIDFV